MNICSICQQPFTEFGNSSTPINDGTCCDYCDCMLVTPERMARASGKPREHFIPMGYSIIKEIKERKLQRYEHKRDDQNTGKPGLQSQKANKPGMVD